MRAACSEGAETHTTIPLPPWCSGQHTTLSRWQRGFDSRWGYSLDSEDRARHPAVDCDALAGDVARARRAQEHGDRGELLGRSQPPRGDLLARELLGGLTRAGQLG